MTSRQVYEGVLIELNKVKAPSLLLEDFNYLFNKAINQYINKKYNIYDVNLQTTDDVRVLKSSAILNPIRIPKDSKDDKNSIGVVTPLSIFGATYDFNLPSDYLHLLNCVCIFKVNLTFKCYNAGDTWQLGAIRLTSDIWPQIINNFYMRPSYKKPYYYIHNINSSVSEYLNKAPVTGSTIPTNPIKYTKLTDIYSATSDLFKEIAALYKETYDSDSGNKSGDWDNLSDDLKKLYISKNPEIFNQCVNSYNEGDTLTSIKEVGTDRFNLNGERVFPTTILLSNGVNLSTVERAAGHRYGNASNVRLEIRYGKDNSVFELENIWIDYLKAPLHIRLTQELIDLTADTSLIMEFPDYVCQEIINELVTIVMENSGDQRIQTHMAVSLSIANPVQALAQQSK